MGPEANKDWATRSVDLPPSMSSSAKRVLRWPELESCQQERHWVNGKKRTETSKGDQMLKYATPEIVSPKPVAQNEVVLVANGDLRQSANEV